MSEQQIGRSPFAVIAELASVTVVSFYLYAYSFFHGFMQALNYQYLGLFSLNDITGFLPWSLVIFFACIFTSVILALVFSLSAKRLKIKSVPLYQFTALVACFALPGLTADDFTRRGMAWIFNALFGVGLNKETIGEVSTTITFLLVAIMIGSEDSPEKHDEKDFKSKQRLLVYVCILLAIGMSSHSSGAQYEKTLHSETARYCISSDGSPSPVGGRLLIASDQNALFELESGELRALSFNAIKSISNKPCPAQPSAEGKKS